MVEIQFIPGAVVSPNVITIPVSVPDIAVVMAAEIVRMPAGATVPDHPVHAHDLIVGAGGGAETGTFGTGAALATSGAGGTVVGGGAEGVQDLAAMVHGASVGADPVQAATPTRLTARTISLNVNTVLGDILTLMYQEVGERVLVA